MIILSNRLPIVAKRAGSEWRLEPGTGGLISALAPVLQEKGGLWIGWDGSGKDSPPPELIDEAASRMGYGLLSVSLSPEEVEGYYHGFSNETIWPLFHSLLDKADFIRPHWDVYREVNRKFAGVVAGNAGENDFVWVHDYQLLLAGSEIKKVNPHIPVGFFLHIPFPSPDIFVRLPWREEIISAMLRYNLLGFQTPKDRRNFVQCVRNIIPQASLSYRQPFSLITYRENTSLAGYFPIGIDFIKYNNLAKTLEVEEAAWFQHEKYPEHKLILGIDRLDYTKGIPRRFEAFELFLEKHPELKQKVSLLQVVIPSRVDVSEYKEMKSELEELVGSINGRFTVPGWVPIHYIFGTLTPVELAAYYRSCEIALITPLNDGMNLVAKEYCASCIDEKGVLILSEFAGAAVQLKEGALLVNPYDTEQTADAIHRAYTLDDGEKVRRMKILRTEVERKNVFQWVESFLQAARTVAQASP